MKKSKVKAKTDPISLESISVGKTQAQQEFQQILDTISKDHLAVEVTDGSKPVAIMLSYPHWLILKSKMALLSKDLSKNPPKNLKGSIKIVGDLERGSRAAAKLFFEAAANSAKML